MLGQKEDYPNGIPECGADALRFALCAYTLPGRKINLDVLRVQGYRFFCNKMWNATKFAMMSLGADFKPTPTTAGPPGGLESPMDRWILSRLSNAVKICQEGFAAYDFPAVTTACYNFWLYELCDVYLECLKPVFQGDDASAAAVARQTLYTCLDAGLRLISPFMPFVTEELWQRLPRRPSAGAAPPSICVAAYPEMDHAEGGWSDAKIEEEVDLMMAVVKTIRSSRSDYNLAPKQKTDVFLKCEDRSIVDALSVFILWIQTLASSRLRIAVDVDPPAGSAVATVNDKVAAFVVLKGLVDAEKEVAKLEKKLEEMVKTLGKLREAAAQPGYEEKVPEAVRAEKAEKMVQLEGEMKKIEEGIPLLKKML